MNLVHHELCKCYGPGVPGPNFPMESHRVHLDDQSLARLRDAIQKELTAWGVPDA